MNRQLLEQMALEKIAYFKKELEHWESFLTTVRNEDVIFLNDKSIGEAPKPAAPAKTTAGRKEGVAATIKNMFLENGMGEHTAKEITAWVLTELEVPAKDEVLYKQKVSSQIGTFERQDKLKRKERKDGTGKKTVYFSWIGEMD